MEIKKLDEVVLVKRCDNSKNMNISFESWKVGEDNEPGAEVGCSFVGNLPDFMLGKNYESYSVIFTSNPPRIRFQINGDMHIRDGKGNEATVKAGRVLFDKAINLDEEIKPQTID